MNILENPDIIAMVLNRLDLNSLDIWNLLNTSEKIMRNISENSQQMKHYNLKIDQNTVSELVNTLNKARYVPIKNATLSEIDVDGRTSDWKQARLIFSSISKTLEQVTFDNVLIYSLDEFIKMMQQLKVLKTLILIDSQLRNSNGQMLGDIPCLVSIQFTRCSLNCYNVIGPQKSVTNVGITRKEDDEWDTNWAVAAFKMLLRFPNIKSLYMGKGTQKFFEIKYNTFEGNDLDDYSYNVYLTDKMSKSAIGIIMQKLNTVRDLEIEMWPFYNGAKILDFLIEKSELDSFRCGGVVLIRDKTLQNVWEILADVNQISSVCSMFRHYKSIKKLTLYLNRLKTSRGYLGEVLANENFEFANIEVLNLKDEGLNDISDIELFLQKLTSIKLINIKTERPLIIQDVLDCMPNKYIIEELIISSQSFGTDENEIFREIYSKIPTLKIKMIDPQSIHQAK